MSTEARSETDLQERLAEIDERLLTLQRELERDAGELWEEPEASPPPIAPDAVRVPPVTPAPEPMATAMSARAPREAVASGSLEAMCVSLLAAMRELLAGYEHALGHAAARAPERARADPQDAADPDAPTATVRAGPFTRIELVREFEATLGALPQVAAVELRGYAGKDRALLEVQLREDAR